MSQASDLGGLCCGLDIGTTNLKAVFVDASGRVRWSRSIPSPRIHEPAGVVTSAFDLRVALETLMAEGWREVGAGRPLRAIATAGVGEDGLPLGNDLSPGAPSIAWFDERAAAEADELAASEAASAALGIGIDRHRTAPKWLWLARHRPAEHGAGAVWVALTDYPAIAWSGRAFMSQTLAARTAAYDVYRRRWHLEMLYAARAPRLPEVVVAGTVIGTVRPGRLHERGVADARTLVVAGGHDHPVAASFIRRFEADAVVDSMGTAELVYAEIALPSAQRLHPRLAYSVPVDGRAGLSCLGVFELAAALRPYTNSCHGDLVEALLAGERPALAKPGTDMDRGADTSRDEALRSAGRALHDAIDRGRSMIEETGARGPIYATGGWSRSDSFLALRAALFGRSIHRFDEDELTGAGAGLIAWSAIRTADAAGLARPNVTRFDPPKGAASIPARVQS